MEPNSPQINTSPVEVSIRCSQVLPDRGEMLKMKIGSSRIDISLHSVFVAYQSTKGLASSLYLLKVASELVPVEAVTWSVSLSCRLTVEVVGVILASSF